MSGYRTSVVMCTHNGERFVSAQLQSLAAQTRLPFELVVSDDCSDDRTLQIVEKFRSQAPFPVVIRRNAEALGYGENFLSAAGFASGDLVAFCDQDDIWMPTKIERCELAIGCFDACAVAHTAVLVDESGKRTGFLSQGISADGVHEPGTQNPWGVYLGFSLVVRKRLLDLVDRARRGPDSNNSSVLAAHDRWSYFLANSFGRTAVIADALVHYRQHASNLFGAGYRSIGRHLLTSRQTARSRANAHYLAAHARVELLSELVAAEARFPHFAEAAAALDLWRRVAECEMARLSLYEHPTRLERISALFDNLVRGRYLEPIGAGLRSRAIVFDLLMSLGA